MKWSRAFVKTTANKPAEATEISHQLMLRTGMIRQVAPGIYYILPLGHKVLANIEKIIRNEMVSIGAQELLMPVLVPKKLWDETGRWDRYGKDMIHVKDRKNNEYALCPTHEEPVTDIVRAFISSYKDLPLILFQIQNKFRDEIRPRGGILRGREFGMKDAYSFDRNTTGMQHSFEQMARAYTNIFTKLSLDFVTINADSGAIGGNNSIEYIARSPRGDVTFVSCTACDYRANIEKAKGSLENKIMDEISKPLEIISTVNMKTVDQLIDGLAKKGHAIPAERMIKTIIYTTDHPSKSIVAVMVRGDDEINEIKLANFLGCVSVMPAPDTSIEDITCAPVGFAGPIGLSEKVRLIIDKGAYKTRNALFGINKVDVHAINADPSRDITRKYDVVDVRIAKEGDQCSVCETGHLKINYGIEVGHVFQLGQIYSSKMSACFHDETGRLTPYFMGCYGIGTTRLIAAIIEQNNDAQGIIWPRTATPYQIVITPTNTSDRMIIDAAEKIYALLKNMFSILYDDRDASPGFKFKDADLIGIPLRITVGNKYKTSQKYELRIRKNNQTLSLDWDELLKTITSFYSSIS